MKSHTKKYTPHRQNCRPGFMVSGTNTGNKLPTWSLPQITCGNFSFQSLHSIWKRTITDILLTDRRRDWELFRQFIGRPRPENKYLGPISPGKVPRKGFSEALCRRFSESLLEGGLPLAVGSTGKGLPEGAQKAETFPFVAFGAKETPKGKYRANDEVTLSKGACGAPPIVSPNLSYQHSLAVTSDSIHKH